MQSPHTYSLTPKIKKIPYVVIIAIILICTRLFYLQIEQNVALYTQSEKNCTRLEKIQSPRGNILDSNGELLATNRPLTNLYWQGQGNSTLTPEHVRLLECIANVIHKPITTDSLIMDTIVLAEKKHKKILLATDLSFEQLSRIKEQFGSIPNLVISTHFKRYYPYKTFACHLLGYLGNIQQEQEGKMGLEKMYQELLKGEQGTALKKITSTGRSLDEVQLKEALCGKTIKTTLDVDLQDVVEAIFPEEQAGTFILMDPEDGAILSLVSRPNFDPNIFLDPINEHQWQELQNKQPFLNRAFNSCYPPGSLFKLVTTSAALELGLIHADSCMYCNGFITYADRRYWCNCKQGHGKLSVNQALAQSCNILFFELGKRMNIDTIADYAHKFGLGHPTNICFPEKEGLIPTSAWKQLTKGERWWPGETLSASIGQSFNLVTPIQIARMIGSIFTGYLVTPRILQEEAVTKEPLDIQEATLEFLKQSMKAVVTRGTGIRVSHIKDIEIFAKTSTAQVCALGMNPDDPDFLAHGWFVAYFKYKNNKPLVIVILAEHAGTSKVSAAIAKNFLVEYKKLMDTRVA